MGVVGVGAGRVVLEEGAGRAFPNWDCTNGCCAWMGIVSHEVSLHLLYALSWIGLRSMDWLENMSHRVKNLYIERKHGRYAKAVYPYECSIQKERVHML